MMWWYDGGPGWAGWLAMSLMMVVFWGLLIAGGIALFRGFRPEGRESRPGGTTDALKLLDERFARGEIDIDEYTERRDILLGRR